MLLAPRKSLSWRDDEPFIAGLIGRGGTEILGRDRPRHLPVCGPLAHEAVDLHRQNGTKRCATAPNLRHRFHPPFSMALKHDDVIDDLLPSLVALRRDLHAHPELAFEERRTAGVVAAALRLLGLEVTEGIAGTGVVGTLRHGKIG